MIRPSGCGTFQTSFTPSAQVCGCSPASPKRPSAAPVRCPAEPSARIVTRARMSEPGSKRGSSSPSRPRPLSPVRTPTTAPSSTSSCVAAVSGSTIAPSPSAFSASARPSCESETTTLPLFHIVGGGGMRTARSLVRK